MALEDLHKRDIIFRDLKPDNILITNNLTVILLDFGTARMIHTSYKSKSFVGTIDYQAPEYHNGKEIKKYKPDCWSLGLILHYLCN